MKVRVAIETAAGSREHALQTLGDLRRLLTEVETFVRETSEDPTICRGITLAVHHFDCDHD